ncbi:WD40 repeat protein [Spironucleus salmonicida]|uniref:Periodic tryptophan protein n=1 Tax=Spironucleus salmonicida TaxID=348837 RepID=V6LXT8_9EUKA|nr:WD40 repeat protein [Spironucleus salmonicida]|eukprot:EST49452.1 Periodic tryptophan protein [Spironucleus salmonicida]
MISSLTLIDLPLRQKPQAYKATTQDRINLNTLKQEELVHEQVVLPELVKQENIDVNEESSSENHQQFQNCAEQFDDSDSDMDGFEYTKNDNVFVTCRSAELGYVDVMVFNRRGDFFLHHNYQLHYLPLSSVPVGFNPYTKETGNFVAISGTTNEIELFDLDVLDSIQPDLVLGGNKVVKNKKGKRVELQRPGSHNGSVLSLTWSKLHPNILVSAGEDTIKVWDLSTQKLVSNIESHDGVVSQVRFHAEISQIMLSCGLSDRKIIIHNFANDTHTVIYTSDVDFEQCEWYGNSVIFTTEDGKIGIVNVEKCELVSIFQCFQEQKSKPLTALAIHPSGNIVIVGSPEVKEVAILLVKDGQFQLHSLHQTGQVFSALFMPGYDSYACTLGHENGNISLFQVYSRIGVENISSFVDKPEMFMEMKDLKVFVEQDDNDDNDNVEQ